MNTYDETGHIFSALAFAARKHSGQHRKGGMGEPYINHLIAVAELLLNTGRIHDTDVIVASILHDTVEDTDTTIAEINNRFGGRTAAIVREVTDEKGLSTAERRLSQVRHASDLSFEARLVKLADKISNVSDIIDNPPAGWSHDDRIAYVRWGKEVVDRIRETNPELEALFDQIYNRAVRELIL